MKDEKQMTIDLIEIRKAGNGYVISAWTSERGGVHSDDYSPRGYETHVTEGEDPAGVAKAIAGILKKYTFSTEVRIKPARRVM